MSFMNSRKSFLLILGGILVLALMAVTAIRSGELGDFINPHAMLFVFIGGLALPLISFPGNEIRCALMHAAGTPGNDGEIRLSILFWEAAGRGYLILGVLHSILSIILVLGGMNNSNEIGIVALPRSLLGALYGILLAVICFIPYWRLLGKLQNQPSLPNAERSEATLSIRRPGLMNGAVIGYIRISSVLALAIILFYRDSLWNALPAIFYWP
jgi:hypothetical protein